MTVGLRLRLWICTALWLACLGSGSPTGAEELEVYHLAAPGNRNFGRLLPELAGQGVETFLMALEAEFGPVPDMPRGRGVAGLQSHRLRLPHGEAERVRTLRVADVSLELFQEVPWGRPSDPRGGISALVVRADPEVEDPRGWFAALLWAMQRATAAGWSSVSRQLVITLAARVRRVASRETTEEVVEWFLEQYRDGFHDQLDGPSIGFVWECQRRLTAVAGEGPGAAALLEGVKVAMQRALEHSGRPFHAAWQARKERERRAAEMEVWRVLDTPAPPPTPAPPRPSVLDGIREGLFGFGE